jgi:DNA-binding PadR family transcriptional regulator
VIELAIVGLLKDQDLHGYELKKQLTELLGPWSSVSFGSLYPALSRLERDGRVAAVSLDARPAERVAVPPTGALSGEVAAFRARRAAARGERKASRGGRNKKVYTLTDAGAAYLVELLTEAPAGAKKVGDDRHFALQIAFCRHLSPAQRLDLFQRRRDELAARLADGHEAGERKIDTYLRSLRDHDTRTLTSDLEWLDQLIADERAAIPTTTAAAGSTDPLPSPTESSAAPEARVS